MKRTLNALLYLVSTFPCGVAIGIAVLYLRWRGYIKLVHPERFPLWQRGVILVSNHPSLLEPILLPGLFLRQFLFHPFLFGPWSTPDQANFQGIWWWWMRPRAVFVPRGEGRLQMQALQHIRDILRKGDIVILFPEGGRTSSAGKQEVVLRSATGKSLRQLKAGLAYWAQKTQALVVPVWIEGTDAVLPNAADRKVLYHRFPKFRGHTITIRIGFGTRFARHDSKEKITQAITASFLQLADEDTPGK